VLLPLAGCGLADRENAASAVAERFGAAVRDRDGAAGCRLLAPSTRSEVEKSGSAPCPESLVEEDLPAVGEVVRVEVYGDNAQVRGDSDTVFLTYAGDGWLVVAAGCTRQPGQPYDCTVKAE
jgi:hypothetical protein